MTVPRDVFDRIYRRHGHRCPMSTLGGRLGWAARQALGAPPAAGVYYIATCALDGIRETTGCSEAEGSLRVEDRGEHRLTLMAEGRGVEATLNPAALEIAGRYRLCSEALERDLPQLAASERSAREREREEILQGLLEELWSSPDPLLLSIRLLPGGARA